MSIASTTRKAGPFTGNGLTTIFPFTFKVFQASDLLVVRTDLSGIETTLTLTTDYTVALNANQDSNPGGTITAISAPASGFLLTMTSNVPELQPVVLTNMGGFYPRVINDALDRLTIFTQQISEKLGRALTLPLSAPSGVSTQLPFPAANKIIAWNQNANGLQSLDPSELATVVAFGTAKADIFSGTGSQTAFTLTASPGALNNLDVSISGVTQKPGLDYTWARGTTITFTSAPPAGTNNVLVRYLQGLPQGSSDSASATFIQAGTGAVTRTAQDKMREVVSVKDFGAKGDDVNDDKAALSAADLSNALEIVLTKGTYKVNSNITISTPLIFKHGAILKPASGVTITLNSDFQAPISQVFDLSLGGVVAMPRNCADVWAEWWGAKGDGYLGIGSGATLNNNLYIQQAIDAINVVVQGVNGGIVHLNRGVFFVSAQINIPSFVSIVGHGERYTLVKANSAGWAPGSAMFSASNGTLAMFNSRIENLRIDANSQANIVY
jgi:hypothetical protein